MITLQDHIIVIDFILFNVCILYCWQNEGWNIISLPGNQYINELTNAGYTVLRIELTGFNGEMKHIEYNFNIENKTNNYRLHISEQNVSGIGWCKISKKKIKINLSLQSMQSVKWKQLKVTTGRKRFEFYGWSGSAFWCKICETHKTSLNWFWKDFRFL